MNQPSCLTISVAILSVLAVAIALVRFQRTGEMDSLQSRTGIFYEAVSAKDYEVAYQMMAPEYRRMYTLEEFEADDSFPSLTTPEGFDMMAGIAWVYEHPVGFLEPISGYIHEWNKVEGEWYFSGRFEHSLD